MNLLKRIICAIKGHTEWRGMGWLGGLIISGDFVEKQQCKRCGVVVYHIVPAWNHRLNHNEKIQQWQFPKLYPDKHTLESSKNMDQLEYFNRNYPVEVQAEVHDATVEELNQP